MSTNKKRFIGLNEDEILAEEVKKFPCLYDCMPVCLYSSLFVLRQGCRKKCLGADAEKLEFLEDGKCF